MVGVDQLVGNRWRVAEHAQPAERVHALEGAQRARRYAGARHAVKPVAAGDVVAAHLVGALALAPAHHRRAALEAVQAHVGRLVDGAQPRRRARLHQVARDLGLAVDGHPPAGQRGEVDAVPLAVEGEFDPFVWQALGEQALPDAGFAEHLDRALLKHARADTPEHVGGALALEDERIDAASGEQLAKQQPCGPRADDCNLGAPAAGGLGHCALRRRRTPSPPRPACGCRCGRCCRRPRRHAWRSGWRGAPGAPCPAPGRARWLRSRPRNRSGCRGG